MASTYSPERKTIGNILSMTNPPIRVPDWQRNYSWTSSEVEIFWKDLLNFDARYPESNIDSQEYFLGSVVMVENDGWSLLLDGQQRLATSAILLSVIRDYLGNYNKDAATRTSHRFLTDYDDATDSSAYKLTLNKYDRDFFRREILESRGADFSAPKEMMESHILIRRARDFFVAQFAQRMSEAQSPKRFHEWVLRIQKVLTQSVSVVAIITSDEDNAASVFETLNDRGIGLSTPDLLRNLIIRRAPADQQEEIVDLWGEILEAESDVKLKTFLRHYWISNYGDVKTQSLYREIKAFVIDHGIPSLQFSRSMRDSAGVYRDILNAQHQNQEVAEALGSIVELSASVLYPLVLSAMEVLTADEEISALLRCLITVYVRHSAIGRLDTSVLEAKVYSLATALRRDKQVAPIVQQLHEFAPSDASFVESFRTAIVADRSTARYLLREIEQSMRTTEELRVALPPRVHVEHIYPQTPKPGERWVEHTSLVNRLGNLTLLSRKLNTSIKNGNFLDKRAAYSGSELKITSSLATLDAWNAEAVAARQIELANHAARIWALNP